MKLGVKNWHSPQSCSITEHGNRRDELTSASVMFKQADMEIGVMNCHPPRSCGPNGPRSACGLLAWFTLAQDPMVAYWLACGPNTRARRLARVKFGGGYALKRAPFKALPPPSNLTPEMPFCHAWSFPYDCGLCFLCGPNSPIGTLALLGHVHVASNCP